MENRILMCRFLLALSLSSPLLFAGCGGGPKSYPEPGTGPDVQQQIEARDKEIDAQEKAHQKAS